MRCRNHPSEAATGQCAQCGKSFCAHCLVPVGRHHCCAACKMKLVPGGTPPPPRSGPILAEARHALLIAILGLFFAPLQRMAFGKLSEAKQRLEADPSQEGQGMVTAARIIAIAGLVLWGLALVSWLLVRK